MDILTAGPKLLKQANFSLIRKLILSKGTATRAEIAYETKISSTTVRSLLAELVQTGEIESVGYDDSSGGRRAERYHFAPDRYYGAAFCLAGQQVHGLLVNICGKIVETTLLEAPDGGYEAAILPFLDDLTAKKDIRSIGVGVPGIVEGGSFWQKDPREDSFHKTAIGETLAQRYGIPVVMENDVNATAIGFGRCYELEFGENPEHTNMAYLHFEETCVSAGFVAGGRILRGYHNYAGELGLIPMGAERVMDDCMSEAMDDARYTTRMLQIITWIAGILNPQYVALGGPALRKDCIGPIGDGLSAFLPRPMVPELLYAPDVWHDYYDGMASLTAGKMFDTVQFTKG